MIKGGLDENTRVANLKILEGLFHFQHQPGELFGLLTASLASVLNCASDWFLGSAVLPAKACVG